MKRSWTACAVGLMAIFGVAGCNDYGNTFQNNTGAVITFLSPSQVNAGSSDFTLTVNGAGFVTKTVIQWNGKSLTTTVPTDSSGNALGNTVTAVIPAAMVAKTGVANVNTLNPASGTGTNGLSNVIAFVINPPPNPLPTLSSVTPSGAVVGSQDLAISLSGTNFLPASDPSGGSQVNWISSPGAAPLKLTLGQITSTAISATIPGAQLASSGSASITVFNPPSPAPAGCTTNCNGGGGGGASAPQKFTICASSPCPGPTAGGPSAAALAAEETPALSLDGRYVAFTAAQNEHSQIFLRDTCEGAGADCQPRTTLLSVSADGTAGNEESHTPSMSSDGRYVAFSSHASNLVENPPTGRQIYRRDTCAGAGDSCQPSTQLISTDSNGALVGTESILPSVSSSGRFVAFLAITPSHSPNPASAPAKSPSGGTNSGYRQVFVRDTCLGAANCTPKTTRISLQPGDGAGSDANPAGPSMSGQGRHVAIAEASAATLFTRSVRVDDRVFLAITSAQR